MKITPSGLIDSITQTSGGTTIQKSYGGLQLHRKAYQRKVKSIGQQTTRSVFTSVQSGWGALTTDQQATWNAAAAPRQSGFELYSSTNNILVGQGLTPIPEYVTPVTPPTNDLELEAETFNFTATPPEYAAICNSPGSHIPTSGWVPYVKWTGWILESQYRYPAAKFTVPQAAFGTPSASSIGWNFDATTNKSFRNYVAGCKAQFIVGLLNTTTGQIDVLLTFAAIDT